MDTTGIAVVVLLIVAIVVIAVLFRRGSFKAGMDALGAKLNVEGRARPEAEAAQPAAPAPSAPPTSQAGAGSRSIHVGRDATGAFVTGDDNRVTQVKGNSNRVDQSRGE